MNTKEIALKYLREGKSVFPVGKDKKPLIEWKEYQTRFPVIEEIKKWWSMYPDANIGIATGKLSNLTVVDFDIGSQDYKTFPDTFTVRTGSGGYHLYYQYYPIGNKTGIRSCVDIRGDGGYVVAPPSETEDKIEAGELVKKGGKYENANAMDPVNFPIEKFLDSKEEVAEKKHLSDLVGVPKGSRNDSMASMIGMLINIRRPDEWDKEIYPVVSAINQTYNPPMLESELKNIYQSICSREIKNRQKNTESEIPKSKLQLWAIGDILNHDFGEEEWLIESFIPKQGMMALSGSPGDYKTWVTIYIAICVSRNIPVFGKFKTTQGAVLIIDEEDHMRSLKKRLELLGAKDEDAIHYLSQNGIKVDDEAVRDNILEIVKEKNIKLLILDSLVRVHQQDENDAKGMAKVFSSLQKITSTGASILFTHHHRKQIGFGVSNPGERMRGSSDILAAVDCHITIEKKRDEDNLILRQTKIRQAELVKPFEVKILKGESGPSGFEYAGGYDEKKLKAKEASEAVVLVLADGIEIGIGLKSRTELQEALNKEFGKTAIDDGIKLAEEAGDIERVPKTELPKEDSRKAYYRIPKTSTPNGENELPVSQACIDTEKQEDVGWPDNSSESPPVSQPVLPDGSLGS